MKFDKCENFFNFRILFFYNSDCDTKILIDGRLPISWYPQSYAEKVSMTEMNMRPDKKTGYPGRTYRFYTGETIYAFGDGLSYTDFKYQLIRAPKLVSVPLAQTHNCRTTACTSLALDTLPCQNMGFDVIFKVRNCGKIGGSHTVFLFISPPRVHNAPRKHLVGFEKVYVHPSAAEVVKVRVDVCKHLSLVDEVGDRKVALGEHVLHIGELMHSLSVRI